MCASRACPRGASLPHCPRTQPGPWGGGGAFCLSLVSPPLRPALPALPPFRPSTRLLPSSAGCHSGVLFPGRVTSGVKELRLGAGPGRAALIMPRSRVGDTPVGRGRRNPPVPEWASSREICLSFVALLHRPCSLPDFYEIQIPAYPEPTSSDLERFTERRVHGVGLCNLKTLLPFFLICTVGMIFFFFFISQFQVRNQKLKQFSYGTLAF